MGESGTEMNIERREEGIADYIKQRKKRRKKGWGKRGDRGKDGGCRR